MLLRPGFWKCGRRSAADLSQIAGTDAATVQTPLPYLYRSVRNTAMNYICETIRVAIPSPQRTNEERADLVAARESLLQALRSK
jgi:hypothetical protein